MGRIIPYIMGNIKSSKPPASGLEKNPLNPIPHEFSMNFHEIPPTIHQPARHSSGQKTSTRVTETMPG